MLGVTLKEEAIAGQACLHSRALLASWRTKAVFPLLVNPLGCSSCITRTHYFS